MRFTGRTIAAATGASLAALLATAAFAQDGEAWTANGPIDYSALDLSGQQVVWADNGGTVHETYVRAYLEPFSALTGAEVISDSPFDYARIRAQVEAETITQDIITGAPYVIEANCGTLFEEVPETHFYDGDIEPRYLTSRCAIPQSVPIFLVHYNTAMYDEAPTSCADFFDLERFPGRRGLWSSVIGNGLEIALLGDGVAIEDVYPMDVERALAKLDTIKNNITFFQNLAVGSEGMMNDNFGMVVTANTRGYDAAVAGATYEPLWDCGVEQISTLGIVKGTPNIEAALALVGYATTPEAQSARMAITAHSPVTTTYELPDDPLLVSFLGVSHPDASLLVMDNAWWADNFDTVEQQFQQWQVE